MKRDTVISILLIIAGIVLAIALFGAGAVLKGKVAAHASFGVVSRNGSFANHEEENDADNLAAGATPVAHSQMSSNGRKRKCETVRLPAGSISTSLSMITPASSAILLNKRRIQEAA